MFKHFIGVGLPSKYVESFRSRSSSLSAVTQDLQSSLGKKKLETGSQNTIHVLKSMKNCNVLVKIWSLQQPRSTDARGDLQEGLSMPTMLLAPCTRIFASICARSICVCAALA